MSASNRKSDSVINVAELRKKLGQTITVPVELYIDSPNVIESRVDPETPIKGELTITSIENGVLVTGDINYAWISECRRCLEPITESADVSINQIYQVGAKEDDEDFLNFDGENVDLFPLVLEATVFALPLAPLCDDQCLGPAPDKYPTQTSDSKPKDNSDDRWDALKDIKFN